VFASICARRARCADGAGLDIGEIEGLGFCSECAAERWLQIPIGVCASRESPTLTIVAGEEREVWQFGEL